MGVEFNESIMRVIQLKVGVHFLGDRTREFLRRGRMEGVSDGFVRRSDQAPSALGDQLKTRHWRRQYGNYHP